MNKFGKWLQEWRDDKGLSQKDVATKLGLSTAQPISNIERGMAPFPPVHIKKYAKILGVPTLAFFEQYMSNEREIVRKKARIR